MSYNVLMFGWEFPPHNSGGLGVACKGLAKALARAGCNVTFVLPEKIPVSDPDLSFVFASDKITPDKDTLELMASGAYSTTVGSEHEIDKQGIKEARKRGLSLLDAVRLYGKKARELAKNHEFDIIHAHDWLTYPAGIAAKKVSGKPLVSHIHATEFDRTAGQGANEEVYAIEQSGFQTADRVVSVSNFTKSILTDKYGIAAEKITPAHNGIESSPPKDLPPVLSDWKEDGKKIVLFLGRQTIQKGPDYFLHAARRLLSIRDDVLFVMAGSGDMQEQLVEMTAELGLADRVFFPGFVRGDDTNRLYQSADLYVLPSVSEPFGITPLESLLNRTPVLISNQSGVSEVVNHALTVDFWDIEAMAHKMDAVLEYPALATEMSEAGFNEVGQITWDQTAETCLSCYKEVST